MASGGGSAGGEVAVVAVAPAPVDALAPSPVPDTPPPTPTDAADAGDPILQAAAPDGPAAPAAQVQRATMMVTQLNPTIAVSVDLPPRVQGAPGVDVRFSLTGEFGL
ncbi:hypothetical protein [Rhizorhabdus argentea]|uniref:hypothetical protein n=1 Tax=Rhizorhabdus argentea TaxID=1387174 RepID=UPI0030ED20D2